MGSMSNASLFGNEKGIFLAFFFLFGNGGVLTLYFSAIMQASTFKFHTHEIKWLLWFHIFTWMNLKVRKPGGHRATRNEWDEWGEGRARREGRGAYCSCEVVETRRDADEWGCQGVTEVSSSKRVPYGMEDTEKRLGRRVAGRASRTRRVSSNRECAGQSKGCRIPGEHRLTMARRAPSGKQDAETKTKVIAKAKERNGNRLVYDSIRLGR